MRMIGRRSRAASCLVLCLVATAVAAPPPSVFDAMRDALRASPKDYVAALVQIVGQNECWNEGGRTICANTVVAVEQFAGQTPAGRGFPSHFQLASGPAANNTFVRGSRYLVIATPLPGATVYSARAVSADVRPETVKSWKSQVERALGGGTPKE